LGGAEGDRKNHEETERQNGCLHSDLYAETRRNLKIEKTLHRPKDMI